MTGTKNKTDRTKNKNKTYDRKIHKTDKETKTMKTYPEGGG